jgi:hypothetical protein
MLCNSCWKVAPLAQSVLSQTVVTLFDVGRKRTKLWLITTVALTTGRRLQPPTRVRPRLEARDRVARQTNCIEARLYD